MASGELKKRLLDPIEKKLIGKTLATVIALIVFLLLVPIAASFIFVAGSTLMGGKSPTEGLVLFFVIFTLIIFSFLLWYILYLRSTSKILVELSVEEKVKGLVNSVEKFQKLFEDSPVPYLILDNKGTIKDLNNAALRFFHGKIEELISKNFFSYITANDEDSVAIAKYYELGKAIDKRQTKVTNLKKEERWVELSFFALPQADNTRAGFVSLFDITDQKNLEQTKTEFVSLASHQLRTPLATIKWYSEMLLSTTLGPLNQKQTEYITTVKDVAVEMADLVNTLLNISRLEIGKITVELQPTNVQEISDSILTELTSQITKKKMNIVKQYNNALTNITSDPNLLRIIIHNLLTNAVKYTPDGGTITLALAQINGVNQVIVADTGYGIPAKQQDKVFTKLFRADNVKDKSSSQSTGLGLYLIKSLVEAIGGKIGFQSVENKGTTFTITF